MWRPDQSEGLSVDRRWWLLAVILLAGLLSSGVLREKAPPPLVPAFGMKNLGVLRGIGQVWSYEAPEAYCLITPQGVSCL